MKSTCLWEAQISLFVHKPPHHSLLLNESFTVRGCAAMLINRQIKTLILTTAISSYFQKTQIASLLSQLIKNNLLSLWLLDFFKSRRNERKFPQSQNRRYLKIQSGTECPYILWLVLSLFGFFLFFACF